MSLAGLIGPFAGPRPDARKPVDYDRLAEALEREVAWCDELIAMTRALRDVASRRLRLVYLARACVELMAKTGTTRAGVADSAADSNRGMREGLLTVNQVRAERGLPPLGPDGVEDLGDGPAVDSRIGDIDECSCRECEARRAVDLEVEREDLPDPDVKTINGEPAGLPGLNPEVAAHVEQWLAENREKGRA